MTIATKIMAILSSARRRFTFDDFRCARALEEPFLLKGKEVQVTRDIWARYSHIAADIGSRHYAVAAASFLVTR